MHVSKQNEEAKKRTIKKYIQYEVNSQMETPCALWNTKQKSILGCPLEEDPVLPVISHTPRHFSHFQTSTAAAVATATSGATVFSTLAVSHMFTHFSNNVSHNSL